MGGFVERADLKESNCGDMFSLVEQLNRELMKANSSFRVLLKPGSNRYFLVEEDFDE